MSFLPVAASTLSFGSDALQRALDAAAGIPATKRGYLDFGATLQGATLTLGQRIAGDWSLGAWGAMEWSGRASAGIRIRGAW